MRQGERNNLSWWVSPRRGTAEHGAIKLAPFFLIPKNSIHHLTTWKRKSNLATGGGPDWFSARHQNSAEPLAWQPTDLRSPSIVCLIDYFPCNYSRVTLNISLLQEGCKRDFFLKDNIHSVTFVSP